MQALRIRMMSTLTPIWRQMARSWLRQSKRTERSIPTQAVRQAVTTAQIWTLHSAPALVMQNGHENNALHKGATCGDKGGNLNLGGEVNDDGSNHGNEILKRKSSMRSW